MTIVVTAIAPDPTPDQGGSPEVVLGDDDDGDIIVDPPPMPDTKRRVQSDPLAGGVRERVIGRGNRSTSFSWSVARDHGDAGTADEFVHEHDGQVPVNCQITITEEETVSIYTAAVISKVSCIEHFGQATVFRYSVEGAVYQGNQIKS